MPEQRARRSLAEKIDYLFATVHPAKGEYSHEQVAAAIADRGGPRISAVYLWQLRTGKRDNPTMKHLEALSGFFGVPPSYFFDEDTAAVVDDELELLTSLRNSDVRSLAVRASGLSPETLKMVLDVVKRARQLEGMPD